MTHGWVGPLHPHAGGDFGAVDNAGGGGFWVDVSRPR